MRHERGSGTLLVVAVMVVLVAAFSVVLLVGAYGVADRRAVSAADQAALAGAAAASDGRDGCAAARRTAADNHALLRGCTQTGDLIEQVIAVEVEVAMPWHWPGLPKSVQARAWAGRVDG